MDEKSYIEDNTGYVFVYNTLKVREELSSPFDGFRVECYNAVIIGSLYDDRYALALDGMNFVMGELHRYENFDNVIEYMDKIEHYYPDGDDIDSLYLRKEVDVTYIKYGKPYKQKAYVYEYNGEIV